MAETSGVSYVPLVEPIEVTGGGGGGGGVVDQGNPNAGGLANAWSVRAYQEGSWAVSADLTMLGGAAVATGAGTVTSGTLRTHLTDESLAALELVGVKGADGSTLSSTSNPLPVRDPEGAILAKSVTATLSGNTTIHTPASGKAIRLWWYNLSADPGNSANAIVGLRFGTSGTDFYRTALSQYGAATAHSFKAGKSYYQGAVNEPLVLNVNVAQTIYANIDFEEVTP